METRKQELKTIAETLPEKAEFICCVGGQEFPHTWHPREEALRAICPKCGGFKGSDRARRALKKAGALIEYCQCIPDGYYQCPHCLRNIRESEECRWSDCPGGGAAYCKA